jgi:hypothetical protein
MDGSNWLNSALSVTQDILAMAKGYDDSNKAATPVLAPVPAPSVVPAGMTAAAPAPKDNSSLVLLAGIAGVVILVSLLSK